MKQIKYKKGFTLIELIVVMAVIGVLVLLAIPKFIGYTEKAKLTEIKSNIKQSENASERYYINKEDWPRLSDTPYTATEIQSYANKVLDKTGQVVTLDPAGNYYGLDYTKLQTYMGKPRYSGNYIIQNPVGEVYYLKDLTTIGATIIIDNDAPESVEQKPTAVIKMTPSEGITTATNISWDSISSTTVGGDAIVDSEWQGKQNIYTEEGTYTVKLRVQDNNELWSDWVETTIIIGTPKLVSGSYTPEQSKDISESKTSTTNNLSSTLPYSDAEGYVGVLNGENVTTDTIQTGGAYTAADTKSVTGQTSANYNIGGYLGTLSQYLSSGSYTAAKSESMSIVLDYTDYWQHQWDGRKWEGNYGMAYWSYKGNPTNGGYYMEHPSPGVATVAPWTVGMSYSYSGLLYNYGISTVDATQYLSNPYVGFSPSLYDVYTYERTVRHYTFSGTITTTPESDTRVYAYSGTVIKPVIDTRTYRTDYTKIYSGTVTKPAVDTRVWE